MNSAPPSRLRPSRSATSSQRRARTIADVTSSLCSPLADAYDDTSSSDSQRCSACRPSSRTACLIESTPEPPTLAELTMRSSL